MYFTQNIVAAFSEIQGYMLLQILKFAVFCMDNQPFVKSHFASVWLCCWRELYNSGCFYHVFSSCRTTQALLTIFCCCCCPHENIDHVCVCSKLCVTLKVCEIRNEKSDTVTSLH